MIAAAEQPNGLLLPIALLLCAAALLVLVLIDIRRERKSKTRSLQDVIDDAVTELETKGYRR